MGRLRLPILALALVPLLGLAALGAYVLALPPLDLTAARARSVVVLDRAGDLLRPFATADGRWRLPVSAATASSCIASTNSLASASAAADRRSLLKRSTATCVRVEREGNDMWRFRDLVIGRSARVRVLVVAVAVATYAAAAVAQQAQPQPAADQVAVPLSDPSRPALIDVGLVHGSITVRGTNRKDILVTARPETDRPRRRADPDSSGMKALESGF